jgi:hypothetical protein
MIRGCALGCALVVLSGVSAWANPGDYPPGYGVPEIDAGSAMSALTVLSGGLLLITDRIRKGRSSR